MRRSYKDPADDGIEEAPSEDAEDKLDDDDYDFDHLDKGKGRNFNVAVQNLGSFRDDVSSVRNDHSRRNMLGTDGTYLDEEDTNEDLVYRKKRYQDREQIEPKSAHESYMEYLKNLSHLSATTLEDHIK